MPIEEEAKGVAGRLQVAVHHQAGPGLVEVAGEDFAIRPEEEIVGIAGGDRLPPGRCEAGDDRARKGLVLAGLDHVGAHVVLVHQLAPLRTCRPGETAGRCGQAGVVRVPIGAERLAELAERCAEGALSGHDRVPLGRAKAEREREIAAA